MKVIDLAEKQRNNGTLPKHIRYGNNALTHLYDEIEILEEPKGIPKKLEILPDSEHYSNKVLYGKINEIIDTLEMLNDKIK